MTPTPSASRFNRRDGGKGGIESQVIEAFKAMGWSVWNGPGPLDLIVAKPHRTFLVEVKDGAKVPSKQRLTKREREFIERWRGECFVVRSVADCSAINDVWGVGRLKMTNEIRDIQRGANV